jgi:hypothetical protein
VPTHAQTDISPASPPYPETPREQGEEQVEGVVQDAASAAPEVKPGGKLLRSGVDAREASALAAEARRRYALSRKQAETASSGLRAAAQSQYDIATGPKSVPASARTAAARAYADLILAAEAADEREGGKAGQIDWDAMHPDRMTLLRHVLDGTEEEVARWLALVEEERNGRVGAGTGE